MHILNQARVHSHITEHKYNLTQFHVGPNVKQSNVSTDPVLDQAPDAAESTAGRHLRMEAENGIKTVQCKNTHTHTHTHTERERERERRALSSKKSIISK